MRLYDSDPMPIYIPPVRQASAPAPAPISSPTPVLDTGLETGIGGGEFYGLPVPPNLPGVSGVGPSRSVQPIAALKPGTPAGSLLARYAFASSAARYGGRVPYQRGFSVEQQERLRRRRKGRGIFGE